MFFWNSLAVSMVQHRQFDAGSSAFSKSSLNIWKFTVRVLLKLGLENFEHYFASIWDEFNCAVVWTFFGIAFVWDWNENWPFPVLWPLLSFLLQLIRKHWYSQTFASKFCMKPYSVQFSHSVMSNSLRPHEPQHGRPPCPSPTSGDYPKSCPLSQWCHPTISSSVIPFFSCPQSFPETLFTTIGCKEGCKWRLNWGIFMS